MPSLGAIMAAAAKQSQARKEKDEANQLSMMQSGFIPKEQPPQAEPSGLQSMLSGLSMHPLTMCRDRLMRLRCKQRSMSRSLRSSGKSKSLGRGTMKYKKESGEQKLLIRRVLMVGSTEKCRAR